MIELNEVDDQDLKETLKLIHKNIIDNCDLVTPFSLGSKHLLHISTDSVKEFPPYISRRAGDTEDNTLPRVYTCKTMIQCIEGYTKFFQDIPLLRSDDKRQGFQNGYYLHLLPFDFALRPNKDLLFDAEAIKEHWLIKYSKETMYYKPEAVVEVICTGYSINITKDSKDTIITVSIMINNDSDQTVLLDDKLKIKRGYYSLNINIKNPSIEKAVYGAYITDLQEITGQRFAARKRIHTSLENHTNKLPKVYNW